MSDPITLKNGAGQLFDYDTPEDAQQAIQNYGYQPAAAQEVLDYDAAKKEREEFGSATDQALAALDLGAGAATFGLLSSDSPEMKARRHQLRKQSPFIAGAAEIAGGAAPALLTAGAGSALGLGRAATAAVGAAGDFASGLSVESELAQEEGRGIDVGNVAMWTVGGVVAENLLRAGFRTAKGFKNNVLPGAKTRAAEFRAGTIGEELSEKEVKHYVENADEIEARVRAVGHDAGNSFQQSFDDAHSIYYKAEDIRDKVATSAPAQRLQAKFADETITRAERLADVLEARGSKKTAETVRRHISQIESAADGSDLFIGGDGLKRSVQKFRKKAAQAARQSGNDPFGDLVAEFDAVETPLQKDLEKGKIWGDEVAGKQKAENAKWSGKDGYIHNSSIFQDAFYSRLPGSSATDYDGLPQFAWDDAKFRSFLKLDKQGQRDVLEAGEKMLKATDDMTKIKEGLGVRPDDLVQLKSDAADIREVLDQVKAITQSKTRGADYAEKLAKRAAAKGWKRAALEEVPVVGKPISKAIDYFAPATIKEFDPLMTREAARAGLPRRIENMAKAAEPSNPVRAGVVPDVEPVAAAAPEAKAVLPEWKPSTKGYQFEDLKSLPPQQAQAERLRRVREMAAWRKREGGWIELPTASGEAPKAPTPVKLSDGEHFMVDSARREMRLALDINDLDSIQQTAAEYAAELTSPAAKAEVERTAHLLVENHKKMQALPEVPRTEVMHPTPEGYQALAERQRDIQYDLGDDEAEALREYVTSEYGTLKAAEQGSDALDKVGPLYGAMKKLEIDNPTELGPLYRGFNVDDAKLSELLTQDKMVASSMLSTSYSPFTAAGFTTGDKNEVILRIKRAYAGAAPFNPVEQEVLVPRGASFRVIGRSVMDDGKLLIDLVQTGVANPKAVAGAVALAAVLGVGLEGSASAAEPEYQNSHLLNENDLAELSEHGKAFTENAAAGFASSGKRPKALEDAPTRFQGSFKTLTDAYNARKAILQESSSDPTSLIEHLSDSYGDLPDTHPGLFGQLAARVSAGVTYMIQNLPPSVGYSMRDPAGLPPSSDAMRQFARLWDAVFEPANVFQDIAAGRATPKQLDAIAAVHPDLFEQFQVQAIRKLSERITPAPYETQRYVDQIMKLGGAYNPAFAPSVAKNIRNSMGSAPSNPEGLSSGKLQTSTDNPRGIASIASGPSSA